jgi:hypothetical protein
VADAALGLLVNGATKGVRFVASATNMSIEGVDNTGVGSFQPLRLFGTSISLGAATTVSARLSTMASTTGEAKFNVPHGVVPTTPTDGDFWSTTAGFYGRVNGVTVGPLADVTDISGKVSKAGDTMTGDLLVNSSTASTSTTTGALTVTGGVGIGGQIFGGGNITSPTAFVSGTTGYFIGGADIAILGPGSGSAGVIKLRPLKYNSAAGETTIDTAGNMVVTGSITTPTVAAGDNTTKVATTAYVKSNLAVKVTVASTAPGSPATNDVWIDTT